MMYIFSVYVPQSHKERLKKALFEAGAGRIGNYSECCWESRGFGQFKAGQNASPYLGSIGKLKKTKEHKLEMAVDSAFLQEVYLALKKNHPYEEPAFHFLPVTEPGVNIAKAE
jgi:hypothetical protein